MAILKFKNPKYTGSDDQPKYISLPNIFNPIEEVFIGDSQPEGTGKLWIDTTDSSIKYNNGGEWVSLPIPSTDTFLSKSEASNTYQPKGDYLTSVPSEYITESELTTSLSDINSFVTFNQSVKNVTSLANLKPTSRVLKYTGTTLSQSLTMASSDGLTVGDEVLIVGSKVSTGVTIALPTTAAYVNLSADTLEVSSGESFEISIIKISTSNPKYIIVTKKSV